MKQLLSFLLVAFGAFFLVFGLFLYLTGWFFAWGLAFLLIGAILILLTKNSWKLKLIVVGIPLIYVAISFYNSFATSETYLIPDNYKGPVIVIFNQADGQAKEFEGGRRLYKIPSSGVLFSQFKDEQGWINQEYYYVTATGKRKKLGVLDTRDFNEEWTIQKNPKEPSRDSLVVFNPGTMGTMGN